MRSSHASLDRVELDLEQIQVAFDDERAVANAGLLLPATLADRLGLEQAGDELVDLSDRPGAAHPGRKVLTVVHSVAASTRPRRLMTALTAGNTGVLVRPPRHAVQPPHGRGGPPVSTTLVVIGMAAAMVDCPGHAVHPGLVADSAIAVPPHRYGHGCQLKAITDTRTALLAGLIGVGALLTFWLNSR
jgi:hypothetical protein